MYKINSLSDPASGTPVSAVPHVFFILLFSRNVETETEAPLPLSSGLLSSVAVRRLRLMVQVSEKRKVLHISPVPLLLLKPDLRNVSTRTTGPYSSLLCAMATEDVFLLA